MDDNDDKNITIIPPIEAIAIRDDTTEKLSSMGFSICGELTPTGRVCHRTAGWGTTTQGQGPCRDHGGMGIAGRSYRTYLDVVTDPDLRALLEEEEFADDSDINNLDGEIRIFRAMIRKALMNFNVYTKVAEDESLQIIGQVAGVEHDIGRITRYINQLSTLIKRKFELAEIEGNLLDRAKTFDYMGRVRNVLEKNLRNTCAKCGDAHNTFDNVFAELALLGNLE